MEDAVAAEQGFEARLRTFASEGDDGEVCAAFGAHADETAEQITRLSQRLEALGGTPSRAKEAAAHFLSLAPQSIQMTHTPDERLAQNLMMAYTMEATECALYEGLIAAALEAGDLATVELARGIQKEEHAAAEKFWSYIPSRSLIAYNMLTLDEINPAVETKVGEASWTGS